LESGKLTTVVDKVAYWMDLGFLDERES
jgi:hypothetical protein